MQEATERRAGSSDRGRPNQLGWYANAVVLAAFDEQTRTGAVTEADSTEGERTCKGCVEGSVVSSDARASSVSGQERHHHRHGHHHHHDQSTSLGTHPQNDSSSCSRAHEDDREIQWHDDTKEATLAYAFMCTSATCGGDTSTSGEQPQGGSTTSAVGPMTETQWDTGNKGDLGLIQADVSGVSYGDAHLLLDWTNPALISGSHDGQQVPRLARPDRVEPRHNARCQASAADASMTVLESTVCPTCFDLETLSLRAARHVCIPPEVVSKAIRMVSVADMEALGRWTTHTALVCQGASSTCLSDRVGRSVTCATAALVAAMQAGRRT